MAKLTPESLQFARNHIVHYWDSDFFPKSFEFEPIWFKWNEVVARLSSVEISELPVALPRIALAPKPNGTYRVVHQLDPLNTLTYTAMVYMIAADIERARAPREQRIACSYRISLEPNTGNLFTAGNGYKDFTDRTRECLANNSFVLVGDIADFYNQIYLHRLQNGIAAANNSLEDVSRDIEHFLISINDTVSRGVPVGPPVSIILAEALLIDIDNFITSRGFDHTRYVDDLRVFSNSRSDLNKFLQDLTLYLHNAHRLILSSNKTLILDSNQFLLNDLDNPDEVQRRELHKKMEGIGSPYDNFPSQDDSAETDLTAKNRIDIIRTMMDEICERNLLDLGLARHVLRLCKRYRIRAIIPKLLDHLEFFAPVMPDVALYLSSISNPRFIERIAARMEKACTDSSSVKLPFVRMWLDLPPVYVPMLS